VIVNWILFRNSTFLLVIRRTSDVGDHDHMLFTTFSFSNGRPVEAYGQSFDVVLQRSKRQF